MATTAFVSEYRSFVSFECKSSSSQFSSLQRYSDTDHRMAPNQQPSLRQVHLEKSQQDLSRSKENGSISRTENHEYSISSPGTSGESCSSGIQASEGMEDMNSTMVNLSSDDSSFMANDLSNCHGGQEEPTNPLKLLQNALEKNKMLTPNGSFSQMTNGDDAKSDDSFLTIDETYELNDSHTTIPVCHFCRYEAVSREDYNVHINNHFQFRCHECAYKARTEGRLKNHMKFHQETNPESWTLSKKKMSNKNGDPPIEKGECAAHKKSRVTKCKHCDFVGKNKSEYYKHLRNVHADTLKLLYCDQCEFATAYKHHLEYHVRNHFGSKPFKCPNCNYSCVNRSMLNSHKKSHSDIYPFRCASCSYASKYCHSLKLHLQKYLHKPGLILNADGTPNTSAIIDVYGRRRGPKSKKKKLPQPATGMKKAPVSTPSPIPPSTNFLSNPSLPTSTPTMLYHPQVYNNFAGNMFMRPPLLESPNCVMLQPPPIVRNDRGFLRCGYCDFVADSQEIYQHHMYLHVVRSSPNLIESYKMNSDPIQYLQPRNGFNNYATLSVAENVPKMQAGQNESVRNISRKQADINLQVYMEAATQRISTPEPHQKMNETVSDNRSRKSASPVSPLESRHMANLKISEHKQFSSNSSQNSEYSDALKNVHYSVSVSPLSKAQEAVGSSNCGDEEYDTTPLDLTRNSPILRLDTDKKSDSGTEMEIVKEIRIKELSSTNCTNPKQGDRTQKAPRNRRKGKAFKLDQYQQYDEQPSDVSNPLYDMEDHIERIQPERTNVKMELEDSRSVLSGINSTLSVSNFKQSLFQPMSQEESSAVKQKDATPKALNANKLCSILSLPISPILSSNLKINGFQTSEVSKDNTRNNRMKNGRYSSSPILPEEGLNTIQRPCEKYRCPHCDICFGDFVMQAMHMTCHSMGNPFTCGKCGVECQNKVGLFDHIINYCPRR